MDVTKEVLDLLETEAARICRGAPQGAREADVVCMLSLATGALLLSIGLHGEEDEHFVLSGNTTRVDVVNKTLLDNGINYYLVPIQ